MNTPQPETAVATNKSAAPMPARPELGHRLRARCVVSLLTGCWSWNALCLVLCRHRSGRMLLHTTALIRNPKNFRWHWQGVRRELAFHSHNATQSCDRLGDIVTANIRIAPAVARTESNQPSLRVTPANPQRAVQVKLNCAQKWKHVCRLPGRRQNH